MATRAAPTTTRPRRTTTRSTSDGTTTAPGDLKEASTGQLLTSIASNTAELVRKELELGRREVTEAVVERVEGLAAMAVAGVLAVVALVFLGLAAAAALADDIAAWAAALIVAAGYVVLAMVAAVAGRARARRRSIVPELAVETTKEDVAWAKAQLKR